jgi:small subunit ribosomal protein S16
MRLMRMGRRNRPFYRIVVADSRTQRQGKTIEQLGWYDPLAGSRACELDSARAEYWLEQGAEPTATVRSLLRKQGVLKGASGSAQESSKEEG